ncbi:MAG: hypothetical protein JXA00_00140 [Candidatus Thermoplasmatota archaeon]|nr:hypothetical protein [Candidatus Thermoplasmatota archaeon]
MVKVKQLFINDMRNIIRDRLLLYCAFLIPFIIIIFTRLVIPWISDTVTPLEPMYPIIFLLIIIMIPIMFGFVIGFLIMDERDEHLLTVLRVMPISRNVYLIYRMAFLTIFSFLYTMIFPALTGLVDINLVDYIPHAVLLSLLTPILGLFANILAHNKVQAFAVYKTFGGIFFLPLFAFYINNDLKYILGVIPNFWTFMALDTLVTSGTQDVIALTIGFITHFILLGVLFYIFNKKF